jgi:hypothetical protein
MKPWQAMFAMVMLTLTLTHVEPRHVGTLDFTHTVLWPRTQHSAKAWSGSLETTQGERWTMKATNSISVHGVHILGLILEKYKWYDQKLRWREENPELNRHNTYPSYPPEITHHQQFLWFSYGFPIKTLGKPPIFSDWFWDRNLPGDHSKPLLATFYVLSLMFELKWYIQEMTPVLPELDGKANQEKIVVYGGWWTVKP